MKRHYLTASAIALTSVASAQSLFSEDPSDTEARSLPLRYHVSVNLGYNDKFTADTGLPTTSSAYISTLLGANYVNYTPRTNWSLGIDAGATKYFSGGGSVYYNTRLNFKITHHINSRMRYVQSTYANYGIEPNYSFSFTPNRIPSEHLYYATDHAIGYRITPRLATYIGVRVAGVDYHGHTDKTNNRISYGVYSSFRYSLSPKSIATLNVRYMKTEGSGSTPDSNDLYTTLGYERQLSPTSYVTAEIGSSYRDVDGGRSNYASPYARLAFNKKLTSQLQARSYVRYGIENYGTSQGTATFDTNQALRVGASVTYSVSPKLSFNAGVNYISYNYSDGRDVITGLGVADADQSLINPYIGFTYQLNENTSINGSYHYTKSKSSFATSYSNYERNRIQLGVTRSF